MRSPETTIRRYFRQPWHRCASLVISLALALALNLSIAVAAAPEFQRVETATLDKQDFVFPDDLRAGSVNIVMLAISEEQDNGEWQGDALVEWYAALDSQGLLSEDVMAWHFSVMKVPFFVKGLIRGGMAKSYAGKLPLNQAGALFVKDEAKFAKSAGLTIDGQPAIVLVTPDGELHEVFKGEVSDAGVAAVVAAVRTYSAAPQPAGE